MTITCRHCGLTTSDWAGYKAHLATQKHTSSLRALKEKLKARMVHLRTTQRRRENLLSRKMENDGSTFDKKGEKMTLFCKLCKLIFSSSRASHDQSPDHKAINEFLNPRCGVCQLQFITPMSYEKHLCSVKHLRTELDPNLPYLEEDSEKAVEDDFDFNPDELVTLDEVGDDDDDDDEMEEENADNFVDEEIKCVVDLVDDDEPDMEVEKVSKKMERDEKSTEIVKETETKKEEDIKDANEKDADKNEEDLEAAEKKIEPSETDKLSKGNKVAPSEPENDPKPPSPISIDPDKPIGHEYVRQVVMYYCDLCHKYLPKTLKGDPDELVDLHCQSSPHQNAYANKEAELRLEEHEALKILAKEESSQDVAKKKQLSKKERITFNEDQLDYEAE